MVIQLLPITFVFYKEIMSNCKTCNKQIESYTGRRPRMYCNEDCRNLYFNANKKTESKKVWKSTYDAAVSENNALKARLKELELSVVDNTAKKAAVVSDKTDVATIEEKTTNQQGKQDKGSNEAENKKTGTELEIFQIEEKLKMSFKYLPNWQRTPLENRLMELKRIKD